LKCSVTCCLTKGEGGMLGASGVEGRADAAGQLKICITYLAGEDGS